MAITDNSYKDYKIISHTYATRQTVQGSLQIPTARLDLAKKHTIYQGTILWLQEVPLCLKEVKSLPTFTKKYKIYLMDKVMKQ